MSEHDRDSSYQVVVKLFDVSVKNTIDASKPIEDILLPEIPVEVCNRFVERLGHYGFSPKVSGENELVFGNDSSGKYKITIVVMPRQIHFRLPNSHLGSTEAIFEAYQTASELCDFGDLTAWFTRNKTWLE